MIIQPNSIIKLFSGVPLDPTYTDTLYFADRSAQTAYFSGLTPVRTFTANTYQRVNLGVFQAGCAADDIYNVNYMAFQNTAYGNRWFYAFVKSVEYVNNGTTNVTFEIDVLQTWLLDVTFKRSMILRQHSPTDTIGGNIEPEPVSLGEYTYEHCSFFGSVSQLDICVMWVDNSAQSVSGTMLNSVFQGCNINAFTTSTTGVNNCKNFIATTATNNLQNPDGIICVYMVPNWITGASDSDGASGKSLSGATVTNRKTENFTVWSGYETQIHGYTIRNKKLLTYPYSFIQINTFDGKTLPCRYEFFNGVPQFMIYASCTPPIQMTVAPMNYKGNTLANTPLTFNAMTVDSYPLCSWAYDTFRAWLAQNAVPMVISTASQVAQGAASGGGAGAAGAAASALSSALISTYQASIKADTVRGNVNSGNAAFSAGYFGLESCRAAVNLDQLIEIDHFFDMYGYAWNNYGVPNMAARPHWTFVQTERCCAVGNCPSDDLVKIKSIFDNGIRFWRNASEVGNYGLDNTPSNN